MSFPKHIEKQLVGNPWKITMHMNRIRDCAFLCHTLSVEQRFFQASVLLLSYSYVLGYGDRKTWHMFSRKTLLIQTSALAVTK